MEKPYLANHIKLDEQALQKAFVHHLNKIHPVLIKLKTQLPELANESCYGDLENAINELFDEVKLQIARIDTIFKTLHQKPDKEKNAATLCTLNILQPDTMNQPPDDLSKDLCLVFYIQKILNIKKHYYSVLKSIANSLNNTAIKQHLQYNYDECEYNQLMFKLIAKEYMESSINPFLN